jgi:predicted nucleic acid-binding protein
MYLIDTNVISELRKKNKANTGVKRFFKKINDENIKLYLSVITIGELRRGVENIRYRNDLKQASTLEKWLDTLVSNYSDMILNFTEVEAQVWGALRVPHHEHSIDKQIAAIALVNDLTVVTRNTDDFTGTGVRLLNPFEPSLKIL